MTTREFIGTTEAAKLLGRNPSTVAKMIKDGRLPGGKIHGTWAIPYDAVMKLAENILPSDEVSRANIQKALETIKPKPISNKAKKSPKARLSTRAAVDRLEPTFHQWLDAIHSRDVSGMRESFAQWQELTA